MVALTRRETEITHLVARGYTNGTIATKLSLSVRTIESMLRAIYTKCEVANRTELALLALADHEEKMT